MRAIVLVLILAGCGIRPLTDEEITFIDQECPQEMYLAGECDKPPLAGTSIAD